MMILAAGVLLLAANPLAAAEVAQGKCIDADRATGRITLEEYAPEASTEFPYGKPTGRQIAFDAAAAKIGMVPEAGDILRIAYTVEGSVKRAVKVMNVSKQDLRKK